MEEEYIQVKRVTPPGVRWGFFGQKGPIEPRRGNRRKDPAKISPIVTYNSSRGSSG